MNKIKTIKALLTGGGTGGHIYPALAVAQVLKKDPCFDSVFYIGCSKNPEKEIVEKEGLEFYSVNVSGMPRKIGIKFLLWLIELLFAAFYSVKYLLKLKPDVVFGTGGYVTGPVLMAAWMLRIPYVIHDPDAHPGIVNKLMAGGAKRVSLAFEDAKKYIKTKNVKILGNPVRESLTAIDKKTAVKEMGLNPEKKIILAIGGSQGARTINNAVKDAVYILVNDFNFQVLHQTGKKNFDKYIQDFYEKYPSLKENPAYIAKPYFEDMAFPLNAADITISRAGSLSISELNIFGLPCILVPYPYAAADHQRFNAKAMEKTGAAIYLEDSECSSEKLIELINSVLNYPEKYELMQLANKALAKPDSAKNIVDDLKNIIR